MTISDFFRRCRWFSTLSPRRCRDSRVNVDGIDNKLCRRLSRLHTHTLFLSLARFLLYIPKDWLCAALKAKVIKLIQLKTKWDREARKSPLANISLLFAAVLITEKIRQQYYYLPWFKTFETFLKKIFFRNLYFDIFSFRNLVCVTRRPSTHVCISEFSLTAALYPSPVK